MTNSQGILCTVLKHALDPAGQRGKDPGQLHFDSQGVAQNEDFSADRLTQGHHEDICRVTVPIRLAIGKFVDVIAPQDFYSLGNSSFRFRRAEPVR